MNTLLLPKQVGLITDDIIYLESDGNFTHILNRNITVSVELKGN